MFLMQYDTGETPDTWLGPVEHWSECHIVGVITPTHLEMVKKSIEESRAGH
jgi:hypothetical protein